ncbi:MAG TPA: MFS transporter [Myxococcota bacterium]|nr:MFS transporter [Myxococcota bacterium]
MREALERNLRLYGWLLSGTRLLFWAPVFFLYFSRHLPLDRVLLLGSIYYVAVVAFEVPSGYLSDRVSRVTTLRLAAGAQAAASAVFLLAGDRFWAFALAQMLLAFSWASLSGTDTSFHLDTLAALGREEEYARREAWLTRNAYLASAASALLGGAAGALELRLPYALSLAGGLATLLLALRLREPPRLRDGLPEHGFLAQLRACLAQLRSAPLAWLFAYVVLMTTLEHIPYEFAQPYVAAVLGEPVADAGRAPLLAGLLTAGFKLAGALAAGRAIRWRSAFGAGTTLLAVTVLQGAVIGAMAAVVHPLVLPLLLLRSVQPAVSNVIVNVEVAPRLARGQRATFLSLFSLAGRLGYGAVLLTLAALAGDGDRADPAAITDLLRWCAAGAVLGIGALALTRRALEPDPAPKGFR